MARYTVTLTHVEIYDVEANDENTALHKAYNMAEYQGVWDCTEVEEEEE